jgi:membrane protease YdiL (CAAX protease family)
VGGDRGARGEGEHDVLVFLALACAITFALDAPWALSTVRGDVPSPGALALTGLGALGPTLAALTVALYRGSARAVFGRWRASPLVVLGALLLVPALHLVATLIEGALGGRPPLAHPPTRPEHVAALVMFSVGEELGWRGYAQPRLAARLGVVLGPLALGAVWTVWHLGMWVAKDQWVRPALVGQALVMLTMASLFYAWVFERSGRSLTVAIALHAGGHLDNPMRAEEPQRIRMIRLGVYVAAGALAALALARDARRAKPSERS